MLSAFFSFVFPCSLDSSPDDLFFFGLFCFVFFLSLLLSHCLVSSPNKLIKNVSKLSLRYVVSFWQLGFLVLVLAML